MRIRKGRRRNNLLICISSINAKKLEQNASCRPIQCFFHLSENHGGRVGQSIETKRTSSLSKPKCSVESITAPFVSVVAETGEVKNCANHHPVSDIIILTPLFKTPFSVPNIGVPWVAHILNSHHDWGIDSGFWDYESLSNKIDSIKETFSQPKYIKQEWIQERHTAVKTLSKKLSDQYSDTEESSHSYRIRTTVSIKFACTLIRELQIARYIHRVSAARGCVYSTVM